MAQIDTWFLYRNLQFRLSILPSLLILLILLQSEAVKEATDLQSLTLPKKKFPHMFSYEFCEISYNTFFKEPFGRLLLATHLSSFQK